MVIQDRCFPAVQTGHRATRYRAAVCGPVVAGLLAIAMARSPAQPPQQSAASDPPSATRRVGDWHGVRPAGQDDEPRNIAAEPPASASSSEQQVEEQQADMRPPSDDQRARGVRVQECLVRFAEELHVPSTEAGLIAEVNVQVGQAVQTDQTLARLDDRQAKIRRRTAQLRLAAARETLADDLELQYAETARAEAQAEHDASRKIYNESSGAVPLSNLRRLRLAVERAELEIARAKKAASQAQIEVEVRAAELAGIEETIGRLQLTSPLSGVVLVTYKRPGEWVGAGESVLRLARIDRLQVQALMAADRLAPHACQGQAVSVRWTDPASRRRHYLRGRVTAVQPQRLAGGRYRIQAEVINARAGKDQWLLHPGTEVEMTVFPTAAPSSDSED